MIRKILITICILPTWLFTAKSQNLQVVSFQEIPNNTTVSQTPRKDLNGNNCAILSVVTDIQDLEFKGNTIGAPIVDRGEYTVYLTKGTRCVQVCHPAISPQMINFQDYNTEKLESGKSYKLVLRKKNNLSDYDDQDLKTLLALPVDKMMDAAIQLQFKGDYTKSFQLFLALENKGENCSGMLALMYERGLGTEKSIENAKKYYKKVYQTENTNVAARLGYLYYNHGQYTESEFNEAKKYFLYAVEKDQNLLALKGLALLFLSKNDKASAIEWFRKASSLGDVDAKWSLADLLSTDPSKSSEVLKLYREAADMGSAYSMLQLGILYHDGLLVEKDFAEALKWYQKAAELKYPKAYRELGQMYIMGEGVKSNPEEGFKYARKAALLGDDSGMLLVGLCYLNGIGVDVNEAEGVNYLRKAAAKGNATAKKQLGNLGVK